MKTNIPASVIVALFLCSCSKAPDNTQSANPAPATPIPVSSTPAPSSPVFPDKVSLVRAIYGSSGAEADVTAQVSAMFRAGQNSIPADGRAFGVAGHGNKLTVVFAGPSGNFQVVASDGQFVTVPPTTTIVRNSRLAPEGVYFLLRYTSITTDDGVIGFTPGTRFTMLKNNGTSMHVTDGKNEVDIPADLLTNDLDVAADAFAQDAAAMAALNAANARQAQAAADAAAAAANASGTQQVKTSTAPATFANPLDKPAYDQHASMPPGYWDIYHHWHSNY